ncbi:MKRN2 opposite strand protein [Scaptodrosophila lebanonensis]|uniref:MKRN2 opposite strand protein n=1 Tax=Drosophila lebanonensis TaxID=7225 RepID=A0A6J2U621_DROLE|nr:MKRN2 opposite strand protein [Scaptodrosophila lebanonensis]XP_030383780.1 MKRN2 opposite strand protein [Scaptodrosophila lebanonensis]
MLATGLTATITSDPGILCFHHCNVKVFCFTLPHTCPQCNAQLDADTDTGTGTDTGPGTGTGTSSSTGPDKATTETTTATRTKTTARVDTRLLPFRLPYPFVRATQYPCAIVLRPSTGDFLNDYNNATDLHIAVTTSAGDIVEFDRDGLQRHRREDNPAEWWQSLLVGDVPEPWHDYWDEVLQQICAQTTHWSIARYEEVSHNCYTFVLAFLQALGHAQLSEAARSKTSFCEQYIVPRTTTAGKYISLYRKLRVANVYVHPPKHRQAKVRQENGSAGHVQVQVKANMESCTNHSIRSRSRTRHTLCTIEE